MATITSSKSGLWSATDTWVGGACPADGDAVTIAAAHSVLMDTDLSAWTGCQTVTITGGATPGMLYFMDGTSGYLKIRTGYNLVGTLSTNRGRLLANSDGTWAGTTALAFAYKAVIDLQGSAKIDASNLDINLRCTEPTSKFVRTYGTKYDFTASGSTVSTANDTIDLGTTPPSAGTAVMITTASGTLPTGLEENYIYYVRSVSGNTCKLATLNSDTQIVDITGTGSGTCTLFTGHTSTSTTTINVLDDVTADSAWVTTTGHNRAILADIYDADTQIGTLTTINAGSIVFTFPSSANIDSAQYPGARIYLSSRNVSIRGNGAGNYQIIDYVSASYTQGGNFGCEIISMSSTYNSKTGYGIQYGRGLTITGIISYCSRGIIYGTSGTVSGHVIGCMYGLEQSTSTTISGDVGGGTAAIQQGAGITVSGFLFGSAYGFYQGVGHVLTGTIMGMSGYGCGNYSSAISGKVQCCLSGISGAYSNIIKSIISGCATGIERGYGNFLCGSIIGCGTGINYSSFTASGLSMSKNTTDIVYSGVNSGPYVRGRSFHHAGTANDTRAWSAGGKMAHETSEVPSGKTYSHKFTFENSSYWTVMEWEITRVEALALSIAVYAKNDATSLTADQRLHWQIIDPAADPLVSGSALAEWISSDSTDWQTSTLSYTRTHDGPLLLRCCAKRASGNAYAYVDPMSGSGGAATSGHMLGGGM